MEDPYDILAATLQLTDPEEPPLEPHAGAIRPTDPEPPALRLRPQPEPPEAA